MKESVAAYSSLRAESLKKQNVTEVQWVVWQVRIKSLLSQHLHSSTVTVDLFVSTPSKIPQRRLLRSAAARMKGVDPIEGGIRAPSIPSEMRWICTWNARSRMRLTSKPPFSVLLLVRTVVNNVMYLTAPRLGKTWTQDPVGVGTVTIAFRWTLFIVQVP